MAQSILWLGAHKTGTTFLQKSLDLSQPALRAHDVHYMALNTFRDKYTRPLLNNGHAPVAPNEFTPNSGRLHLIFDENIPALVQHVCTKTGVYAPGQARAQKMAAHLELDRPVLVLGIRSFAGYLPSLYCETLKSTPFKPFREFFQTPLENLRWYPWIKALQAAFPGSGMLVYPYEALRGNEKRLLSYITRIPASEFTLLEGVERPGFSQRAIDTLQVQHKQGKVDRQAQRAAVKHFPKGAENPGFMPWDAEEIIALQQEYARDLARLREDVSIDFMLKDALPKEVISP